MKLREEPRAEAVFVIRMWGGDDHRSGEFWRASVTYTVTGERRYFTNYGDLCDFLERWRTRPLRQR